MIVKRERFERIEMTSKENPHYKVLQFFPIKPSAKFIHFFLKFQSFLKPCNERKMNINIQLGKSEYR